MLSNLCQLFLTNPKELAFDLHTTSTLDAKTGHFIYRGGFINRRFDLNLIKFITIEQGVRSIKGNERHRSGRGVFEKLGKLEKVIMADSCVSISKFAFRNCALLTDVTVSENCTHISDQAFLATNIIHMTIPNSCLKLGNSCFFRCTSLITIDLGDSCISIGDCAFAGCSSLITITVPKSCRVLRRSTFMNCTGLVTLNLNDSIQSIGNLAMRSCTALSNILLPTQCKLGMHTFYGCTTLAAQSVDFASVELYLRYRYRQQKRREQMYNYLNAFIRCDIYTEAFKGRGLGDGIGANKERDIVVGLYRRIPTPDVWRMVFEFMILV